MLTGIILMNIGIEGRLLLLSCFLNFSFNLLLTSITYFKVTFIIQEFIRTTNTGIRRISELKGDNSDCLTFSCSVLWLAYSTYFKIILVILKCRYNKYLKRLNINLFAL